MLFTVMATANHWWLDGVGGAIAVLVGARGRRAAWPAPCPRPGRAARAPMRIAMVTEYAYPVLGGVPEHVHNLSRELVGARPRGDRASPASPRSA